MKVASILANIFFAVFVTISGILYVLNHTANASYLQSSAKEAGVYENVSSIMANKLTEVAIANSGQSAETVESQISGLVSKEYIQSKSEEVTSQIEQVLSGESEKIVIDFSDLAAQASAQGLAINSTDLKPIEITLPENTDTSVVKGAQSLDLLQFVCYTVTVLLLVISVILAILRRSSLGLGIACLVSAVVLGMLSLILRVISPVFNGLLELPEAVNEITPSLQKLVRIILSDGSKSYMIMALVLLVAAAVCFITHKFIKKRVPSLEPAAVGTAKTVR